jgi:hypothetical protein
MLSIGRGSQDTIEGIQVYKDHADENQFYYLPGPVQLAQRNGAPVFSLIKYNPSIDGKVQGGGYLSFEVDLRVPEEKLEKIRTKLARRYESDIKLSPVDFDLGTVKCIAPQVAPKPEPINPEKPAEGSAITINAKDDKAGESSPSLSGDNSAVFGLSLNQYQATILQDCFKDGVQPIAVYYDLQYTAMSPSLNVELKAKLDKVYEEFQFGAGIEGAKIDASIRAGLQNLLQRKDIEINVISYVDDEDAKQQKREALSFFMEQVVKSWLEPVLVLPKSSDREEKEDLPIDPKERPVSNAGKPPTTTSKPPSTPAPTNSTANAGKPTSGSSTTTTTDKPISTPTDSEKPTPPTASNSEDESGGDFDEFLDAVDEVAELYSPQVYLRLRYIKQTELKEFTYRYNGSQAVKRKYYPQGFFSLLLKDGQVDPNNKRFIRSVNLDDPFFQNLVIQVLPPSSSFFSDYGGKSVDFAVQYDNKPREVTFTSTDTTPKSISFGMSTKLEQSYKYQAQYHFTGSTWEAKKPDYQTPWLESTDRSQTLDPTEHVDLLNLTVKLIKDFSWERIQEVRVYLKYKSADPKDPWSLDETIVFYDGSPTEKQWKARLTDKAAREGDPKYTYLIEYRMKDGSRRKGITPPVRAAGSTALVEEVTDTASQIIVSDLLQARPEYSFRPQLKGAEEAYVTITYDDEANDYHWEKQLEFTASAKATQKVAIPLLNASKKAFGYSCTFLDENGDATEEIVPPKEFPPIILIRPGEKQDLSIEVNPTQVNWNLVRYVVVNLRQGELQTEMTFEQGNPSSTWKVSIPKKSAKQYEWQARFYMKDSKIGDRGRVYYPAKDQWEKTDDVKLQITEKMLMSNNSAKSTLKIRLQDNETRPHANKKYEIWIDGKLYGTEERRTSNDGFISAEVPTVHELQLKIWYNGDAGQAETVKVKLDALDPIDTIAGIQDRLNNLGYICGNEQGTIGSRTKEALRAFQMDFGLTPNGEIDELTRKKVQEAHDVNLMAR